MKDLVKATMKALALSICFIGSFAHAISDAKKIEYLNLLGLKPGATLSQVKKAYRRAAKKYHPDTNPTLADGEEKFKEAKAAYEGLDEGKDTKLTGETDSIFGVTPGSTANGATSLRPVVQIVKDLEEKGFSSDQEFIREALSELTPQAVSLRNDALGGLVAIVLEKLVLKNKITEPDTISLYLKFSGIMHSLVVREAFRPDKAFFDRLPTYGYSLQQIESFIDNTSVVLRSTFMGGERVSQGSSYQFDFYTSNWFINGLLKWGLIKSKQQLFEVMDFIKKRDATGADRTIDYAFENSLLYVLKFVPEMTYDEMTRMRYATHGPITTLALLEAAFSSPDFMARVSDDDLFKMITDFAEQGLGFSSRKKTNYWTASNRDYLIKIGYFTEGEYKDWHDKLYQAKIDDPVNYPPSDERSLQYLSYAPFRKDFANLLLKYWPELKNRISSEQLTEISKTAKFSKFTFLAKAGVGYSPSGRAWSRELDPVYTLNPRQLEDFTKKTCAGLLGSLQ